MQHQNRNCIEKLPLRQGPSVCGSGHGKGSGFGTEYRDANGCQIGGRYSGRKRVEAWEFENISGISRGRI